MEEQNLLSKKELLALTGISYGQLYRWKRQNLIPESWFIKQSSFTGQETFFPKDKVLKRVEAILKLKDQHSLDELAEMFTPELTNKIFRISSVRQIEVLDQGILNLFAKLLDKESFTFRELLFVYALSESDRRLNLGETWLVGMATTVKNWLPQVKSTDYRLLVCRTKEKKFSLLIQEDSAIFLDHDSEVLANLKLNELADELHPKLSGLEELE
ncbi:MAG: DUF4004 family protein [Desulfitobacteriaceae bacterium]